MKRLHRFYPLSGADEQTDIRILGGFWFKESAGSTARVKLLGNALDDPTAPTAALNTDSTGSQITAGSHSYKVTFVTAEGETEAGATSNAVVNDATHTSNAISGVPLGGTGCTARKIYRNKVAAQTTWYLQQTIANNTATVGVDDITPDASLGAAAPTSNTTGEVLFDIPFVANETVNGPVSDMPVECGSNVFVEVVSGSITGTLIGQ